VVRDVWREWNAARQRAVRAGLLEDHIWFDPGIGFAKSARHSFELLRRLGEFRDQGVTVVVGASRKSFIASLDGSAAADRLGGSLAAALHAASHGAQVLRVHDVADTKQALLVQRELDQGDHGVTEQASGAPMEARHA
jgi:dihydropteroate synthase